MPSNDLKIGYIFKRKDNNQLSLVDLKLLLTTFLFELKILDACIIFFDRDELFLFDSSVGDWKCQTRTSMIIDIKSELDFNTIFKEKVKIKEVINSINNFLSKLNSFNAVECKNFTHDILKKESLSELFQNQNLKLEIDERYKFLTLCFLTTKNNYHLSFFAETNINKNKFKELINSSKAFLCRLSIRYETKLAQEFTTNEEAILLSQIETKAMQTMTSLYAGFIPIFKKMKAKKQPFFVLKKIFCSCGGLQKLDAELFEPTDQGFASKPITIPAYTVVSTIDSYQFPGSLAELQTLLNIPHTATDIPKEFLKPCNCNNPYPEKPIDSFDEAIMAFFAQHPQFTNGAQIQWEKLGLQNSEVKKEYDRLLTLKGFSRNDMSIFHINHMYASTIENVLKEKENLEQQLKQPK